MKVVEKQTHTETFSKLNYGEVFYYFLTSKFYMVLEPTYVKERPAPSFNKENLNAAVELTSGKIFYFNDNDPVRLVNGEFTEKEWSEK